MAERVKENPPEGQRRESSKELGAYYADAQIADFLV